MADVNSAANSTAVLDGYLTRENLAAQLGKSMRTIDRWEMHRSGPPRVLIGKTVLYRLESVRDWLLSREQRRGEPRRRQLHKSARKGSRA